MMVSIILMIVIGLVMLVIGILVGYILRKSIGEKTIGNAEQKAKNMILDAENRAETVKKELVLEDVSFTVEPGQTLGIIGSTGSGKTTLIKLLCGLLQPTAGRLAVAGLPVGPETKALVSYLPDRMYFASWMRAVDLFDLFRDFYRDFDYPKALAMCKSLGVEPKDRLKSMSKGTKEKVQLVLVMARKAQLYLLDEPIAGVDPAARDFILRTILTNYNEEGTVLISTHLIADIEKVLDEVILLKEGALMLHESVDRIREERGKSVDALFREIFRAVPMEGGEF